MVHANITHTHTHIAMAIIGGRLVANVDGGETGDEVGIGGCI